MSLAVLLAFMGKWLRRSKVLTTAEWMEFRFGSGRAGQTARLVAAIANLVAVVGMVIYFAKGTGAFLTIYLPFSPEACSIGMIAIDRNGDVCAGCSTSGLAWKIPGRVGDSPIVGAGAYCDNGVGGAAATGNGDVMMRFCPAFLAVELMREGASPAEACTRSLSRITKKGYKTQACLVAVNRKGEFGAAKIGRSEFPHAVRNADVDEVRKIR